MADENRHQIWILQVKIPNMRNVDKPVLFSFELSSHN